MQFAGRSLVALALFSSGCDSFLTSVAAGSTVRVFGRAAPALQRFADIELAEAAIPNSIATLEGLMVIETQSDVLHVTLAQSYASYGFAFLMDHMEEAHLHDDEDRAEHFRARASSSFLRARAVAFDMMSIWEPDGGGVAGHVHGGLDAWRTYLGHFDSASEGGILFWGAYAWAQYVGLHRDDVNALADLPFATALAERAGALNPAYNNYAPRALIAGLLGSAPAQLGGHPDLARTEFDAAIEATHRHNLMFQLNEAQIVAVSLQDRALFRRLLQEVMDAGDVDPELRLSNLIAKRRARRLLTQVDDLFAPEEPGAASPAPPAQ